VDNPAPDRDAVLAFARTIEGLRVENAELRVKAAECDVLTLKVETLMVALEEARRDRDRWAVQAHALAHPPISIPAPRPPRVRWWWLRRA
jgi:hypothetical protein